MAKDVDYSKSDLEVVGEFSQRGIEALARLLIDLDSKSEDMKGDSHDS
jgi:hypothetical protein